MRILCPHCHAEESRCPEQIPACRERGAEIRALYAAANGNELEALRAENERLRAAASSAAPYAAQAASERAAARQRRGRP